MAKNMKGDYKITGSLEVAGTITSLANEFVDNAFALKDDGDATKKASFQCSGITAGQNRVMTIPNYNGTLATQAGTETFTNKTLTSPKIGTSVLDTNGLELLKLTATASAVNELTLANAAANGTPTVSATGDDTNISIKLSTKGTGKIIPGVGDVMKFVTVTTKNEASDQTYTAAQLLGGMIIRDPNGGARQDTLPTAANIVAAIPGAVVGTGFEFTIKNSADAGETITVATPGAPVTLVGTMTIAQSNSKRFLVVLTNVTAASEAVTVYSLGTVVH